MDAQGVEQAGECVGLPGGRGIIGKRAAQVTKARGGDRTEFLPDVSACDHKSLVEPAKDAVHYEQGISFPERRVFDGATVSFDDLAAAAL